MGYSYPYSIATLSSSGARPTNGRPIYAVHFNRLFQEVTALQSALGINPRGTKTDVKTRLAQYMENDGTYFGELICEDDPSGNQRGTTRYLQDVIESVVFGAIAVGGGYVPFAYTPFDDPPVFIWCLQIAGGGAYNDAYQRVQIRAETQIGALLDARQAGGGTPAASTVTMAGIAISQNLKVWQEDVAWALPPIRTGS